MSLRDYLRDNLFDGSEGGTVTTPISTHLDRVCEIVAEYLCDTIPELDKKINAAYDDGVFDGRKLAADSGSGDA